MPALVFWSCVPSFQSVLLPCAWRIGFEYGSISRFKGVFSAVWVVYVGLCCSGNLRGLWGFCTRVELGGLKACGVFASVFLVFSSSLPMFILFSSCVSSQPALFVLVSLGVFISCCGCVVGFSFSLSVYTQKRKGAISYVLSYPVVGCCVRCL